MIFIINNNIKLILIMNKVLYIGAGDDINIINIFKCNHFVLIDTLPRSSHDEMGFYEGF